MSAIRCRRKFGRRAARLLEDYSKRGAEQLRQANQGMRSLANSLKRLEGQQNGLLNPRNFAKKEAEEKDLRDKLAAKPDLDKLYAPAWAAIAKANAELPAKANQLAFSSLGSSRLATIAQQIVTYHIETAKPDAQRYAEYREARIEAFKSALLSPAPIYPEMDEAALTHWMTEARKTLGASDPFVKAALGNAEPAEVVGRAIRETKLTDPAARKAMLDGGAAAIVASTDPMITLARRAETDHSRTSCLE